MSSFAASLARFKKNKLNKTSKSVSETSPLAPKFSALVCSKTTTLVEADLWAHFREAGGVISIKTLKASTTGGNEGPCLTSFIPSTESKAVVTFSTLQSLHYATKELDGVLLWGSEVALLELTAGNGDSRHHSTHSGLLEANATHAAGDSRLRVVALPNGADPATYEIPLALSSGCAGDCGEGLALHGTAAQPPNSLSTTIAATTTGAGQLPTTTTTTSPPPPRCHCQGSRCSPNVVVGGVGGSGTRLVAQCLEALGYAMGPDQNESSDNLFFTLLFKRKETLALSERDFLTAMSCMAKGMGRRNDGNVENSSSSSGGGGGSGTSSSGASGGSGGAVTGLTREEDGFLARCQESSGSQGSGPGLSWLRDRATKLRRCAAASATSSEFAGRSGGSGSGGSGKKGEGGGGLGRWGWKEPNSHLILDRLACSSPTCQSRTKYIHVVRSGLDMAYSENQNQLSLWGRHFLGESSHGNDGSANNPGAFSGMMSPAASLRYWVAVHRRVLRLGGAHNLTAAQPSHDSNSSDSNSSNNNGRGLLGADSCSNNSTATTVADTPTAAPCHAPRQRKPLGPTRFLLLNFDDLCSNPRKGLTALVNFLFHEEAGAGGGEEEEEEEGETEGEEGAASSVSTSGGGGGGSRGGGGSGVGAKRKATSTTRARPTEGWLAELVPLVKPPSQSLGRFRHLGTSGVDPLCVFDPSDVSFVGRLGFDVDPAVPASSLPNATGTAAAAAADASSAAAGAVVPRNIEGGSITPSGGVKRKADSFH